MKTVLVYITTSSQEEAGRIGRILVEKRLAACVNILAPIQSLYRWEGKIQNETEIPFLAKTTPELFELLAQEVRSNHSYSNPCIVALPIERGSMPFLEWIIKETGPEIASA
ncbi:MAG: divalent-cation tolerance protein CutA [Leptospirales bacterium]|nr:divalent-cation tolerance protein CutA [Leptospirales bacterium]